MARGILTGLGVAAMMLFASTAGSHPSVPRSQGRIVYSANGMVSRLLADLATTW
jgi:hypothetical protein